MYCPAKPVGIRPMGMKFRKPLRPDTENRRPSRIRAIRKTVFIGYPLKKFPVQNLHRLELGPDGVESRLQDSPPIGPIQARGGSAGVDEAGINHTDEAEHRAEVRLD